MGKKSVLTSDVSDVNTGKFPGLSVLDGSVSACFFRCHLKCILFMADYQNCVDTSLERQHLIDAFTGGLHPCCSNFLIKRLIKRSSEPMTNCLCLIMRVGCGVTNEIIVSHAVRLVLSSVLVVSAPAAYASECITIRAFTKCWVTCKRVARNSTNGNLGFGVAAQTTKRRN